MELPVVYVINLGRNRVRLRAIAGRLDRLHLRWERIDAVDGREFGSLPWPHFNEFAYRYLWGKIPHPNELGCYLSHYRALRTFIASGAPFAVVAEDDAVFADDFEDVLAELVADATSWDVVKLESRHWGWPVTVNAMSNGRRLVAYTQRSTGAAAYLVDRIAAAAYIDRLLPMNVPYDHAFDQVWRFGLRMRGVLPRPAWTSDAESDIGYGGTEGTKHRLFRRTIAPLYRAQIETARIIHYLFGDPVLLKFVLQWIRPVAVRGIKRA